MTKNIAGLSKAKVGFLRVKSTMCNIMFEHQRAPNDYLERPVQTSLLRHLDVSWSFHSVSAPCLYGLFSKFHRNNRLLYTANILPASLTLTYFQAALFCPADPNIYPLSFIFCKFTAAHLALFSCVAVVIS